MLVPGGTNPHPPPGAPLHRRQDIDAPPCGSSHDNPKGASYDKIDINPRCRFLRRDVSYQAFGQGVDPLIGTWKFNPEKSQSPFPQAKSAFLTFTMDGQNLINTAEGVGANGLPYKIVFQHIYDGQPHPTKGMEALYDASAFTRVGNTINAARYKDGKLVQLVQVVVVPGKTYTIGLGGVFNGQPFHSVTVYEKQ